MFDPSIVTINGVDIKVKKGDSLKFYNDLRDCTCAGCVLLQGKTVKITEITSYGIHLEGTSIVPNYKHIEKHIPNYMQKYKIV